MAATNNPEIRMNHLTGALLLRFHKSSLAAAIALAIGVSPQAFAQSSGTEAIEDDMAEVVVSATRVRQIGIVGDQTAAKSRITLTGEYLESQTAGNTLFQGLNQLPGVNFTNNDPYGSSGGNLRLRSFDGSRVSVTFDGVPLNDSGNYALFTNQMLDPELVDRVDVNLGTTDVDSPTASATGGTIAFRTRRPKEEFGGQSTLSLGENNYRRIFARIDSGEFGPWGTKAYVAASLQTYDKFKGPGELEKKQFNSMIRQDFENGNFVSLAFHFNRNRNAFYRNASDANFDEFGLDYDNLPTCTRDTPNFQFAAPGDNDGAAPNPTVPGLSSGDNPLNPSSCGNFYGVRINPSDTGNIRMQSLWNLGDSLKLTFDPSWQYTLANGGGSTVLAETPGGGVDRRALGARTDITGFDLNGDGDVFDQVRFHSPNNTNTKRWGATTSLIWEINDDHRMRFAYTWDRARHRQTAQWGYILENRVQNVFAGRQGERVYAADGEIIRGRDRFSVAELKQYALEYRGQFLEDKFTATVGLRKPEFSRDLNQYCYTPNGGNGNSGTISSGGTYCTARAPVQTLPNGNVTFNPGAGQQEFIAPWDETIEFDDLLPNLGLSFSPWDKNQFYLSYAQGLSAPRTDNLYSIRRQDDGSLGRPLPESETTKSYDLGWRFSGEKTLASVAVWKIDYTDRIVSSFDQELGFSVDRNVGDVKLDGVDAQAAYRFTNWFSLSGSASYIKSELQENVLQARIVNAMTGVVELRYLPLAGKELVETPEWTFATRLDFDFTENLKLGLQGKYVGDRFSTDLNDEVSPSYTVLDLDFSYGFTIPGFEKAEVQLTVSNLLDEEYYGGISSGPGGQRIPGGQYQCISSLTNTLVNCGATNAGFFSIGAPRTAVASFKVNF
jgi:iron complex outermembrane receptor protein